MVRPELVRVALGYDDDEVDPVDADMPGGARCVVGDVGEMCRIPGDDE